jgi:hypothetical protein
VPPPSSTSPRGHALLYRYLPPPQRQQGREIGLAYLTHPYRDWCLPLSNGLSLTLPCGLWAKETPNPRIRGHFHRYSSCPLSRNSSCWVALAVGRPVRPRSAHHRRNPRSRHSLAGSRIPPRRHMGSPEKLIRTCPTACDSVSARRRVPTTAFTWPMPRVVTSPTSTVP